MEFIEWWNLGSIIPEWETNYGVLGAWERLTDITKFKENDKSMCLFTVTRKSPLILSLLATSATTWTLLLMMFFIELNVSDLLSSDLTFYPVLFAVLADDGL